MSRSDDAHNSNVVSIEALGIDDPKLQQLIKDDIGELATTAKGQLSSIQVLAAIRQVDDATRGGVKFDDSMAKVQKDWKPIVPAGQATDAYKAGVFHGASAVLLAGAMGSRFAADRFGGGAGLLGRLHGITGAEDGTHRCLS